MVITLSLLSLAAAVVGANIAWLDRALSSRPTSIAASGELGG